ncbi:MAG: hypothetical protein U9Q98_01335 [Bacteroidota bacterium]|nr:hypothetical protein [Bacteroidota bacterium]
MKKSVIIIMAIISAHVFFCSFVLAQHDSIKMVEYDLSYDFQDGVYLNFQQFRMNAPVSFSSTGLPDPESKSPGDALVSARKLSFFDAYGIKQTVPIDSIWGYSYNNKIYVYWAGNFYLIPYIGNISHFVAKVQVRYDNRTNPFYDPYYVYTGPSSYVTNQTVQMLLDTETGNMYNFEPENVLHLIKDNPDLYKAYSDLSKRKQRKLMFYYIRQYNEEQPLYFPAD